jgi:hypothetical protein
MTEGGTVPRSLGMREAHTHKRTIQSSLTNVAPQHTCLVVETCGKFCPSASLGGNLQRAFALAAALPSRCLTPLYSRVRGLSGVLLHPIQQTGPLVTCERRWWVDLVASQGGSQVVGCAGAVQLAAAPLPAGKRSEAVRAECLRFLHPCITIMHTHTELTCQGSVQLCVLSVDSTGL